MLDRMKTQVTQSSLGNLVELRSRQWWIPLLVSVLLSATGVGIYIYATGWVAYAGAVWAILNIAPVVQWVMGV